MIEYKSTNSARVATLQNDEETYRVRVMSTTGTWFVTTFRDRNEAETWCKDWIENGL